MKKINAEGVTEKTVFYQGEFDKGVPSTSTTYEYDTEDDSGPLFGKMSFDYDYQTISGTPEDPEAQAVVLQSKVSEAYENNQLFLKTRENYTYYDYETYGANAHGGIKQTVTIPLMPAEGETITTEKTYVNMGDWAWRVESDTLSGSVHGFMRGTDYTYNALTGNLETKTLAGPNNPTFSYEYDGYGNLTLERDPKGLEKHIQYDTQTNTYPWKITSPSTNGVVHEVEYEYYLGLGKVKYQWDENDKRTDYYYDPMGREITVNLPNGGQSTTTYHDNVSPSSGVFPTYAVNRIKENSSSFIENYTFVDGFGRAISTASRGEDSKIIKAFKFYDRMGRENLTVGPFFDNSTAIDVYSFPKDDNEPVIPANTPYAETFYDIKGRVVEVLSPDPDFEINVSSFSYNGLATTVTDPDGSQKTERKDWLGRLREVVEYNQEEQYTTRYEFNTAGDLLRVVNALQNPNNPDDGTIIHHDTLGRKTDMTDPDMGYWQYFYDLNGNLDHQIDANGTTITFTYDALNRILTKTCVIDPGKVSQIEATPNVTYTYDLNANGIGRLYRVQTGTPATTTIYWYDSVGQVTRMSKAISGDTTRNTYYVYDLSGKVTQITYPVNTDDPDGLVILYGYINGTGLLERVSESVSPGPQIIERAYFSDYEPTGKIGKIEYKDANGNITSSTEYNYDDLTTRLMNISTNSAVAGNLQNKTYEYSPAGDILSITSQANNGITTYSYDYDGLHRLIGESVQGSGSATGNLEIMDYEYELEQIHAVSGINKNGLDYAFAYDANGNNTSGYHLTDNPVARTLKYNADNMPTKVWMAGVLAASFIYDGEGARVKKIAGTNTTYYVGDHFEVANGTAVNYIFAGNLRIAKKQGLTLEYFHKDHLGSSTVVVTESGTVQGTTEYMPFGSIRSGTGSLNSNYMFTDQERDVEIGLYNYGARLYDPIMGVFVSADTVVPHWTNPQSLNRYSYCLNNSLYYVDPNGHNPILIGMFIGAMIGGGTAAATGGDVAMGMLTGAISGAMCGVANGIVAGINSAAQASALQGFYCANVALTQTVSSAGQAIIYGWAGSIAGGINAMITGSDAGTGMLAGMITGSIGGYYGDEWSLGRVGVSTLAGGGIAEMSGGNFGDGALYTFGASSAAYAYYKTVGFNVTWKKGGKAVPKDADTPPVKGANTIGYAVPKPGVNFFDEGGPLSTTLNNTVPGINAVAGLHDIFQIQLDRLGLRNVLCWPGMLPAAAFTYTALMTDSLTTSIIATQIQRQ